MRPLVMPPTGRVVFGVGCTLRRRRLKSIVEKWKKLRAAGVALEKKETKRQDKTMVATTTRSRSRP
jgi:hypothetical protein